MVILMAIGLILLTCIVIWRASDGFETASEYLGRNLSEGVRGATINAIASSMPELFTTLFFLFVLKDKDGFAGGIGTTAGSAVFNAVIIPASVILVVVYFGYAKMVKVSKKVILRDGISLLLAELILIYFIGGAQLNWWHGLILMAVYVAYIVYMFSTMKRGEGGDDDDDDDEDDDDEDGNKPFLVSLLTLDLEALFLGNREISGGTAWALLLVSTGIIGSACYMLVYSCEMLGEDLGIPTYFIAVLLAAAATSVPDTIISIRDGMRGNYDDAVSNAVGSNIFDICFALGFPLFLFTIIYGPITMEPETVANVAELRIWLFILTAVAVLLYYIGKGMGAMKAMALLAIYVIFVLFVVGRALHWPLMDSIGESLLQVDHFINGFRFW